MHGTKQQGELGKDVPVSKHHGVAKALRAGLVEPLPATVTLQHLQVPSGKKDQISTLSEVV